MSRVEENAKLRLPSGLRTDKEIWMAQAKFLEDISRSLAVIADYYLDQRKKLYCDCTGLDEAAVINLLRNKMPKKEDNNG